MLHKAAEWSEEYKIECGPNQIFGHYANLPDVAGRCGKNSSSTRTRVINPGWGRMLPGSIKNGWAKLIILVCPLARCLAACKSA